LRDPFGEGGPLSLRLKPHHPRRAVVTMYCVLLILMVGNGYANRTSMNLDEVLLDREVYDALPRRAIGFTIAARGLEVL